MISPRQRLSEWLAAVLAEFDPRRLVRDHLRAAPGDPPWRRLAVIALGKAAAPMLAGFCDAHRAGFAAGAEIEIVYSGPAPAPPVEAPLRAFAGGHPDPNPDSLLAAAAMLAAARRLAACGAPALLAVLISGGGSAMAEMPLGASSASDADRAAALEQLRHRNRALVRSGASITEINLIRKHLSAFKAGRLAVAAHADHVDQRTWLVSDVVGDDPAVIASGPTHPDPTTLAEASAALARVLPGDRDTAALLAAAQETPKPGDAVFARSRWDVLAGNRDACAALAALALGAGYDPVIVDADADESEAGAAAAHLAARWRALRAARPRPCLIAGGEIRVRVPESVRGRGGRNLHLALRLALELEGEDFTFLSAGTDGVDGSSDAAGAIVDGRSAARGRALGLDPEACLRVFDAHAFFAATGELLRTGPTGNNLRDLRCFLPG